METPTKNKIDDTEFYFSQAKCMFEAGYNTYLFYKKTEVASKLSNQEWTIIHGISLKATQRIKQMCSRVDKIIFDTRKNSEEEFNMRRIEERKSLSEEIENA